MSAGVGGGGEGGEGGSGGRDICTYGVGISGGARGRLSE